MKKCLSIILLLALANVAQADTLKFIFTHHSSASNTFWQAVKKGMDDACQKVEAQCQMIFTQTEGSVEQQVANIEAAIATKPTALFTTIVDDNAFDEAIKRAREAGITVLSVNVDDSQGAKGNAREAFIGQGFTPAGYALGQAMAEHFPTEGAIQALIGISAPGQNWSEARGKGVMDFLDEYKAAHPNREVTYKRIDSGTDFATTADRVGAYLSANPNTTVYFDTGLWHAAVAGVLADRGIKPGKVLLGGFDLVPEVLDQMDAGYIQAEVDQQPYMQGYMPVMQAYLKAKFGLTPTDMNTGKGIVRPRDVSAIRALSEKGIR